MTDVKVDDFQDLVDEYADRMRRHCKEGEEVGYAHAFVEALTDVESRHSNARRLQRVTAVNAAATLVRKERFSPARGRRPAVTVNPQVTADSDSESRGRADGRGEAARP